MMVKIIEMSSSCIFDAEQIAYFRRVFRDFKDMIRFRR